MEQKQRFVSLLSSDRFTMTELCVTFGISRKTGIQWRDRHAAHGMAGLEPRSRAPRSVTCRTDDAVERLIVAERRLHPTWGAKKIRRVLEMKHGLENPPVVSTVGEVLKRHGMVRARRRRGGLFKIERGALTPSERCNHVFLGQVLHRNIFPAKTCRVIGQNQLPEQTPLPSRHLLFGAACASRYGQNPPRQMSRRPLARRLSGGRSLVFRTSLSGSFLATSSRPPAAPFAVQTRPPCAPLSRNTGPAAPGRPVAPVWL